MIVRHGYTVDDIHTIARQAVFTDKSGLRFLIDERIDAAQFTITVLLHESVRAPTRPELVRAGWHGSTRYIEDEMRHHGVTRGGGHIRGSYARYWTPAADIPLADRVVDRVALYQIWQCLTERDRSAVAALASESSRVLAARSIGLPAAAFASRLKRARKAFLELWHEGETPSPVWARGSSLGPGRGGAMRKLRDQRGRRMAS